MFDETAERAKLEALDLTEDVIDMIIKKKRATYESKNAVVIPSISIEPEPTYYPPCDSAMLNVYRTEPQILEPTTSPCDSAMLNVYRTEPQILEPTTSQSDSAMLNIHMIEPHMENKKQISYITKHPIFPWIRRINICNSI